MLNDSSNNIISNRELRTYTSTYHSMQAKEKNHGQCSWSPKNHCVNSRFFNSHLNSIFINFHILCWSKTILSSSQLICLISIICRVSFDHRSVSRQVVSIAVITTRICAKDLLTFRKNFHTRFLLCPICICFTRRCLNCYWVVYAQNHDTIRLNCNFYAFSKNQDNRRLPCRSFVSNWWYNRSDKRNSQMPADPTDYGWR